MYVFVYFNSFIFDCKTAIKLMLLTFESGPRTNQYWAMTVNLLKERAEAFDEAGNQG